MTLFAALCGHRRRMIRAGPIAISRMVDAIARGSLGDYGSARWMSRTAKSHRLNARPRPIGRGLRGRGWEKGLSPELCGPGFQGGSGRPRRIQRWSPAADPLLTCTKSTKFMDNCQAPLLCRDSLPEVDPAMPGARAG